MRRCEDEGDARDVERERDNGKRYHQTQRNEPLKVLKYRNEKQDSEGNNNWIYISKYYERNDERTKVETRYSASNQAKQQQQK